MKEGGADGDEARRQGHPRRFVGTGSGWRRKWRVTSGTAKVACRCNTLRADIEYGFAEAHTTYGD